MERHEKFIEYLRERESDPQKAQDALLSFVQSIGGAYGTVSGGGTGNGGANAFSGRSNATMARPYYTPQELTKRYDETIGKRFFLLSVGVSLPTDFFNAYYEEEILYLVFLFLRRNGEWDTFVKLYEAVFASSGKRQMVAYQLLWSYDLYYQYYSAYTVSGAQRFLQRIDQSVQTIRSSNGDKWLLACYAAMYITAAELMYAVMSQKEYEKVAEKDCRRATEYANWAIECYADYAVYYYIKAKNLFLTQKADNASPDCEEIVDLLNTAIQKENDTEYGVRQKSRYEALKAEVVSKITERENEKMKALIERTRKDVEEANGRSIRRFSAFTAVITVIAGLLGKFTGGSDITLGGGIGFVLSLVGAAIVLFAVLDGGGVEAIYLAGMSKKDEEKDPAMGKPPKKVRARELAIGIVVGGALIAVGIAFQFCFSANVVIFG